MWNYMHFPIKMRLSEHALLFCGLMLAIWFCTIDVCHATIACGGSHTCAKLNNGQIKCWGNNFRGGLGGPTVYGTEPNTMGENLPIVNLGVNRTVVDLDAGWWYTCAIMDNGQVKCWGYNAYGSLGLGRSEAEVQLSDQLPAVNLGTGRFALQISIYAWSTCALLDNHQVKCWGYNVDGQLGQGHANHIGFSPNDMGDNLPPINLGTGRTALQIAAGYMFTCAILDNGAVKCWGANLSGYLGQGHSSNIGNQPNQMGDNLPPIRLGTGLTATHIAVGANHVCAILNNGKVKCWGSNVDGQLGKVSSGNVGDEPSDMGDNLLVTDLGTGRTAIQLSASSAHTCAILDNGKVKCWGFNKFGTLGLGNTLPNNMGDALPTIDLGTGLLALKITGGATITCVRLSNREVKCWGRNENGQLGQGHNMDIGGAPNQMGDNLPSVKLMNCAFLNCGESSICYDPPINDKSCKCIGGFAYDTVILRVVRDIRDMDSIGRYEVNHCHQVDAALQVSNFGVQVTVNVNPAFNISVSIGLTNWQVNPTLFGPPFLLEQERIIPGNSSRIFRLQDRGKYTHNGQEFYLVAKFTADNTTIVDKRFVLPCGCDATSFLDYPPVSPRADDGRPIPGRIVQRQGKLYVSWTDNSICATQFSLHRVLVDNNIDSSISVFRDDPTSRSFEFSNEVQKQVNSEALTSVSVVSDFLLDSTTCFKKFAPIQFLDDVVRSRLAFGTKVYYCMTASSPSLGYTTAYSCTNKLFSLFEEEDNAELLKYNQSTCTNCRRLSASDGPISINFTTSGGFFWETNMKVKVLVGKYSNTPEKDVLVTWFVTLESGQEVTLARANSATTDVNGEVELPIIASSERNPLLRQNSTLLVSVFSSKATVLSNQTVPHRFNCDEPSRECSESKPLVIEAGHLAAGQIYSFRDVTQVAISGHVTIDGTQDADYGVALGCPLQGAEVCAYPAGAERTQATKIDCFTSTASGEYAVVVPMSSTIDLTVTMKDATTGKTHAFASQNWIWESIKVGLSDIQNINFMDVQRETLYVDVFGGDCQLPLASAITVKLSRRRSGCGAWTKSISTANHVVVPASASPTSMPTTSPSVPTNQPSRSPADPQTRSPTGIPTRSPTNSPTLLPTEAWEITMPPTKEPSKSPTHKPTTAQPTTRRPTASPTVAKRFVRYQLDVPAAAFEVSIVGLTSPIHAHELDGLVEYFTSSPFFKGDNQPTINLAFVNDANADDFSKQSNRLVTFRFDVEPVLDLQFYQGSPENRVDFPNRPEKCGYRARVLKLDFYQTTWARVTAVQTFFDGMTCSLVSGTILVQDNLWESGSVKPALVNECKQLCTRNLTSITEIVDGFPETFSAMNLEIEPTPEKTSPHVNTFGVQYASSTLGVSSTVYTFTILTPGDVADSANNKYDVTFTDPILLTIVRDPPGDASTQTFSNAETTVVAHSTDYSAFFGASNTIKTGANFKFEGETCAFGIFCGTIAEFNTNMGLTVEESFKRPTGTGFQGGRTLSRTYTWSYSTPSMLNSALKKRTRGSDSDMFLVMAVAVVFIPTVTVKTSETTPCDGEHEIVQKWLSLDELGILQGNVDTSPNTVMWVSRGDIRDRIIPQLETDNEPENDKYIVKWQQILARGDKYKLSKPAVTESDMQKFEEALQDFATPRDAGMLETATALDLFGFASGVRDSRALYKQLAADSKTVVERREERFKIIEKYDAEFNAREDIRKSNNPIYVQMQKELAMKDPRRQKELAQLLQKFEKQDIEKAKATNRLGRASAQKVVGASGKMAGQFMEKTAPIVGLIFSILELALAAGYMGDVAHNGLNGGTNTTKFEVQKDEDRTLNQKDIFGDANMPSFKPFGSSTRGLWGGGDIKQNGANVLASFRHDATMIAFSGGGSMVEFSISDLDDSSLTSRIDGYSTDVKIGGYGDSSISPGFASDGSMTFDIVTDLKQSNTNQRSTSTSATVNLGDSSPGDYFLVQVFRDQEFGTFVFNTMAGLSSCPHEDGTIKREDPAITFVTRPDALTHPDEPATFHIKLENNALYDSASFSLNVGHLGLKDDVRILVNGMVMDKPILFEGLEPLHSYPVLIQVYRGSENDEYTLDFDLRSMCEDDMKGKLPVTIKFAPQCPEARLAGALAAGPITITSMTPSQIVALSVRHLHPGAWLWTNFSTVTKVGFQFLRYADDNWVNAESVTIDGDVDVDMIAREDPILHFASYDWNLSPLNLHDSILRVRAIVTCEPGSFVSRLAPQNSKLFASYSQEGIIRIDRAPPLVYKVHPQLPFPGTDEIVVEFTEPVRCGPPLPFLLSLNILGLPSDMTDLSFDQSSGNVLVKCKDSQIVFSIPSNIPAWKLLNLKVVATLENVKDLSGNRAQANIAADSDKVQVQFQFANIDLDSANFVVRRVIVGALTTSESCNSSNPSNILSQISQLTGLNQTSFKFFNSDFTNKVCAANLAISGADVTWHHVQGGRRRRLQQDEDGEFNIGSYFDMLVAENIIQFAAGGGVDVAPPESSLGELGSKFDSLVSRLEPDGDLNGSVSCSASLSTKLLDDLEEVKAEMASKDDLDALKGGLGSLTEDLGSLTEDLGSLTERSRLTYRGDNGVENINPSSDERIHFKRFSSEPARKPKHHPDSHVYGECRCNWRGNRHSFSNVGYCWGDSSGGGQGTVEVRQGIESKQGPTNRRFIRGGKSK